MKTKGLFVALMALMMCFVTSEVYAQQIAVKNADGVTIYYNYNNIDGTELEVTNNGSDGTYSGSVVIPEEVTYANRTLKVTSIGSYAFEGCSGLTSVTIPGSVTSIGGGAFRYCSGLTSVTIPGSVTSIGISAFEDCSGLTSVTIPGSVTSIETWAFSNCSGLTSVTIPGSVTNIGDRAFQDCRGLTSVTIQDGVKSIGGGAFYGCSGLTSVTIPRSVTSIGGGAFADCSGLTSVTIPNSMTSIGGAAFYGCSGLTSITLPTDLESIGNSAFGGCAFTSIHIPHRVKTIGDEAFSGCRDLALVSFDVDVDGNSSLTSIGDEAFRGCSFSSITIPNSVITIGSGAFTVNNKLTTAILSDGITEIASYTFRYCGNLASITIPENVTRIGEYAFGGCSSLRSIKIPESVTSMGENAFSGCGLESIELPNSVTEIPANLFSIDGLPLVNSLQYIKLGNNVKSIGKNAFRGSGMVIEIGTSTPPAIASNAFPNVTYLADLTVIVPDAAAEAAYRKAAVWKEMTFTNLNNIAEVTVDTPGDLSFELITECDMQPAKVVSLKVSGTINADDFSQMLVNMKSLLRLDLSDCDITEIPEGALMGKTQLQELTLPTKLKTIGNNAFKGCPNLRGKLSLPSGVTSIGDYAFEGTSYTSVTLPARLKTIGSYTFNNVPLKQKLMLPDALTSIGDYAFADTHVYGHAEFPDGIKYLGAGAFRNTQIDPVSLPDNPDGITSISRALFQGCSSFDYIYIPRNFTEVSGYAFDGCTNLRYVRMSPNLEILGEYAFQNTQLEYLKVPSKVEVLSRGVLKNCKSLESLSLPANLTSVEEEALIGCTSLRNLSVEPIEPPTIHGRSSIRGINTDLCLISIPTQSYKKYVLAEYWGQFVQMRNDIAVETEGDGEIAFESVVEEEEEEEVSASKRRGWRSVAARAMSRASAEEDEPQMTFANNGSSVYVPKNGKVRFIIIPGEGEELLSATLDGQNIMPFIEDGVYTATADKKNAKLVVKFSENMTVGIQSVDNGQLTDDSYYDLSGRRIDGKSTKKGVYILNGKKVVIK